MRTIFYKELSKVLGAVLVLLGIAALIGANFAHNYVRDQLSQEGITMPSQGAINALSTQEHKDALTPYIGEPMTTGPQAESYANHFIWDHMMTASKNFQTSDGQQLASEQYTYAGIGAFTTAYVAELREAGATDADIEANADVVALNELRASTFQGNTLRSMLLTSYAFWLIGDMAFWAGIAALIIGVALLVVGFVLKAPADSGEPSGRVATSGPHETTT